MKSHTELVREFHDAFMVASPPNPRIPPEGIRKLRRDLIHEEAHELLLAEDPNEALDAIADLLYVVEGAAIAYGFSPEQVDAAFREVHRSNMTKIWPEDGPAPSGDDVGSVWHSPQHGGFIVTRTDGKIMKPPTYSPANLEPIVKGEINEASESAWNQEDHIAALEAAGAKMAVSCTDPAPVEAWLRLVRQNSGGPVT